MTYDDVLYDMKEALNINSDDRSGDVPDAYLMSEYSSNRAFIIEKTYNKGTITLDEDLVQRLVVPMGPVDKGLCGIQTNCYITRSIDPLPSMPISLKDGPMLSSSSTTIGAHRVKVITEGKVGNVGNSTFTKDNYFVFYSGDGHVYLISKRKSALSVKFLAIYGIFEDPEKVSESNTCEDFDCSKYPIKGPMHKYIMDMTLQGLMQKIQIPEDKTNNADGTAVLQQGGRRTTRDNN